MIAQKPRKQTRPPSIYLHLKGKQLDKKEQEKEDHQ